MTEMTSFREVDAVQFDVNTAIVLQFVRMMLAFTHKDEFVIINNIKHTEINRALVDNFLSFMHWNIYNRILNKLSKVGILSVHKSDCYKGSRFVAFNIIN